MARPMAPADPLAFSHFAAAAAERDPVLADWLGKPTPGRWAGAEPLPEAWLADVELLAAQHGPAEESAYAAALRRWRQRQFAAIACRALSGTDTVEETLAATSVAAVAALRSAAAFAASALGQRHGQPLDAQGRPLPLVVVAMGKLGGGELNFSSDLDLVFLFPEHGETAGPRPISFEEYYTRLGQQLIRLLDAVTAEGFVFRIDMRLRPFGDSGPLVASFAALEDYLQSQGRDWERYAWVKARAVTGQAQFAQLFRSVIRPFVYRRYLDFGVFDSLRAMKAQIEREVQRRELSENVKLGPGGIREIEFIAQSLQLIRGGHDERLQTSSLLAALQALAEMRVIPADTAGELRRHYLLLRQVENCLQMRADQQVHLLPAEPEARAALGRACGFDDWRALDAALRPARAAVAECFRAVVFGASAAERAEAGAANAANELTVDIESLSRAAAESGFGDAPAVAGWLLDTRAALIARRLDETGLQRLDALLWSLLKDASACDDAAAALRRVLHLLERIGRRSAYFALLNEQPAARRRLLALADQSEFLIGLIATYPLLLDELLDVRLQSDLPDRASLRSEIAARLAAAHDAGEERQVEKLLQFQRAAMFHIAVADLDGRLPLMRVSDHLTALAEVVLEQAMELAWQHLTPQLGMPSCGVQAERRAVRICAVGYGKLGGMELGYGSDLDLVFLHDSAGEQQHTDGAREIDNQIFFVRFAQRVVHLLTMHSSAGRLYEVDMRLRPSGKGGMLITGIDAFGEYQRTEAWTWEHQALLHARAVAGDVRLCERFEQLRLTALRESVRRAELRAEVARMRERMRAELARAGPGQFDLKQDAGGVADIEFLAQYWALRWAERYPPLLHYADTIRQLESVASADLVPQTTVDALTDAYRRYRRVLHHQSLHGGAGVLPAAEFAAERAAVSAIWRQAMQL